jgi:hypothetical protein
MELKKGAMKTASLLCMTAMVTVSCISMGTQPTSFDKDAIVVQAYLYAGRPVTDIHLMHLAKSIYNEAVDTIDTLVNIVKDSMVNNAMVTISNNGVSCRLALRDSGWYQDTSKRFVISEGQTYRLDIFADGRHAWAETTVPFLAGGITASRETLYTFGFPSGGGELRVPPDSLTHMIINWNNPNHTLFYYQFILDPNPPYSDPGNYITWDSMEISSITSGEFRNRAWFQRDTAMPHIGPFQAGKYKMLLLSTTPEYQTMRTSDADSTHQDFLNSSSNSINGGLGLFTSFGVDSVSFYIKPWTDGGGASANDNGGSK